MQRAGLGKKAEPFPCQAPAQALGVFFGAVCVFLVAPLVLQCHLPMARQDSPLPKPLQNTNQPGK